MLDVRQPDPYTNAHCRGHRVDSASKTVGEIAHETADEVVAADHNEMDEHRGASLPQSTCRICGVPSRQSAGRVQFAVKPEITSLDQLRDVEDLSVVHAEMFYDVIHGVQPSHRIPLNVKGLTQVRFSQPGQHVRGALHGAAQCFE